MQGPTDAWDPQQFKHMNEEEYKKDTPEHYFSSTYVPRPAGQTDAVLQKKEESEIKAKGKALAKESEHSHKVPTHEEKKKSLMQRSHHRHHKRAHRRTHRQQRHHKMQQRQSLAYAPPNYRVSAWTDEQHDASHPKEWTDQTNSEAKGYVHSLYQMQGKPAPQQHAYRVNAWTSEQHDNSNEKEWHEETLKPSGYQVTPSLQQKHRLRHALHQRQHRTYPAGDQKSWIEPYKQRDHAWNTEQHDTSHEKEWHQETLKPTGYQVQPGLMQRQGMLYPAGDQKSWIEPYKQRDHAWNVEQHDTSHEKEWHQETLKPTGYQVQPGLMQRQGMIYPAGDQKSWIEPYKQRDHAWNVEQHDTSHEKEWHQETLKPSGYQVLPGSLSQGME